MSSVVTRINKRQCIVKSLAGTLLGGFVFAGVLSAADLPELHPAIPLLDEQGQHVLDSGQPYSPRQSCGEGGCHDYDKINHAYHFEMGRDEASDDFGARRGLPHLVSPGYFGGYACMGGSNPEVTAKKSNATIDDFADKGSAGLVQRCISCHPGGGWMELDRNGERYDEKDPASVTPLDGDYFNRGTDENNQPADNSVVAQWDWQKSGVVENDCMICHADFRELVITDPELDIEDGDSAYDHFRALRRTHLVREGFFREAGTAIMEFVNLSNPGCGTDEGDGCATTDSSLLNFDRTVEAGSSDPDYALNLDAEGKPLLNWNPAVFDADGKVQIPMLRFSTNDNCMMCHRTSNSRRGFYGFGEGAEATYDEDGALEEDYQDDVHKGRTWTEAGEERGIEICNTCHGRNYFNPSHANTDLDANHDFLKGNSDMDVRNDLDFKPNALSCEYCHNDAETPAIPSGQDDMLGAHLERWKNNVDRDMAGYPQAELARITQTHLDVLSCQACHITGKKDRRGGTIQIMYRYRQDEKGMQTIVPYNPRVRYYWRDKVSGRVLNRTERNSVFEARDDGDGGQYGVIIDPVSGNELAQVTVRMSHGSLRFGDPADYEGFVGLKMAYDNLLVSKGVAEADTELVWTESNHYLMSHNTRPAVSSVQCEECHERKQNGSFSSLVSADGLLGEGQRKSITTVVDTRLVDEGIVRFEYPYMKMDQSGEVTESIADILYYSRLDPSMSVLGAARAKVMAGKMDDPVARADVGRISGITDPDDAALLNDALTGQYYYPFVPQYGDDDIRRVALLMESNGQSDQIIPTYRMEVAVAPESTIAQANSAGFGGLVSPVISLQAFNSAGQAVSSFNGDRILVKLPYDGSSTDLDLVRIITSSDGAAWSAVDQDDILLIRAKSNLEEGYIAFWTGHFSLYAVANKSVSTGSTAPAATSSSGGGGAIGWPMLLLSLLGLDLLRRRNRQAHRLG